MAERKVLTKYYPPDFDPSALTKRKRVKRTGPKVQPVRLMAPFSMRCLKCNDYIYKGRKFNARKETLEERYYSIPIYRFYICCPSCSSEICFKTDPKNMDYECEKGARRNFEPWREAKLAEETEEERLDRLEREEAEKDVMAEVEKKQLDAKTEMAIADALDDIRSRNARNERMGKGLEVAADVVRRDKDSVLAQQEAEDAEAARRAFSYRYLDEMEIEGDDDEGQYVVSEPTRHSPPADPSSVSSSSAARASEPVSQHPSVLTSASKESSERSGQESNSEVAPEPTVVSNEPPPQPKIDFSRKSKAKARPLIKGLKPKTSAKDPLGLGY